MAPLAEVARAWKVRFAPAANPGEPPFGVFREPAACVALATPIEPARVFEPGAPAEGEALLLVLRQNGAEGNEAEKEADAFFADLGQREPVFRGSVRTTRVAWSRSRIFIACTPDVEAESIDAALRFTLAARATFDLERDMAAAWPLLDKHAPLSHAVTGADQAQQPQVNAMTEQFTRMKAVHLRVQTAIEQLDPMLGGHSKRLFAQLSSPAALHDRMEMLEDPIQFGIDHYELANTRLIEGKYSATELRLEWLIVIILLAELIAILADKFVGE